MSIEKILEMLEELEALINSVDGLTIYATKHAQTCIRMAKSFIKENKENY